MVTLKVTKLFESKYVDIKDYERQEALDKKVGIIILHNGHTMTLTPKQVKNGIIKISTQEYQNKIKGRPNYKMLSYLWKPDPLN